MYWSDKVQKMKVLSSFLSMKGLPSSQFTSLLPRHISSQIDFKLNKLRHLQSKEGLKGKHLLGTKHPIKLLVESTYTLSERYLLQHFSSLGLREMDSPFSLSVPVVKLDSFPVTPGDLSPGGPGGGRPGTLDTIPLNLPFSLRRLH